MHKVTEIGGLYFVERDTKVKADHKKAARDLLRLRFGDGYERDLLNYLRVYAFTLPECALSIDTDTLTAHSLLVGDGESLKTRLEILESFGVKDLSNCCFTVWRGGNSSYSRWCLEGGLYALVSPEWMETYQKSVEYVANLALINNGVNWMTNRENRKPWWKDTRQAVDYLISESVCATGYLMTDGGKQAQYNFVSHMPDLLCSEMSYTNGVEETIYVEGFEFVSVKPPDKQSKRCRVSLVMTPDYSFWSSRHDLDTLHRIAAGCLYRWMTEANRPKYTVDASTLRITCGEQQNILRALDEWYREGGLRPCAWCGKPVVSESYCHRGRCAQNANGAAKADFSKGMSAEELQAKYPNMRKSTIAKWFREGQ